MSVVDENKHKHLRNIAKCKRAADESDMLHHHGAVLTIPNNQPKSWGQKCN